MYLNRLLFPAPPSTYDIKKLDKELIYIPRERSRRKDFKIQRPITSKSDEEKKTSKNKFMKLFKGLKTPKPLGHSKTRSPRSEESSPKKSLHHYIGEDQYQPENDIIEKNDIESSSPLSLFKIMKELEAEDDKDIPIHHNEISGRNSLDSNKGESKDDKSKSKKKKKVNCFGFLLKHGKSKKFDFEDHEGHPHEYKLSDMKHLSRDIINQLFENRKEEVDKDSSSESDDEHLESHNGTFSIKKVLFIPCLCLYSSEKTSKTLLYFHGNGEDINSAYDMLYNFNKNLLVSLIICPLAL